MMHDNLDNTLISVVLAEDNVFFGEIVYDLLSENKAIRYCGHAVSIEPFKALVEEHKPQIALLDLDLDSPRDGIHLLRWLQSEHPCVRSIIMTVNEAEISECYEIGARAYLLKSNIDGLESTIRDVHNGKLIIPPATGEIFLQQIRDKAARQDLFIELRRYSQREIEILKLLRTGLPRESVAEKLCISDFTVKRHIENIRSKSGKGLRGVIEQFNSVLDEV